MIDTDSPTWRAVKVWAELRIEQHRRTLETVGLVPADYETARGAVRDLRLMLALPDKKPTIPPDTSGDIH